MKKYTVLFIICLMALISCGNKSENKAQTLIGKTYVSYWINPYGDGSKEHIGQKLIITFKENITHVDDENNVNYRECNMIWNREEHINAEWYYDTTLEEVVIPVFYVDRINAQKYGLGKEYYDKFKCYFNLTDMIFSVYDYQTETTQQCNMMEQ
ncbi:MAG: hypothetical protein IJU35_06470 [Paludibacteraceae bacterium]|nr:hypothetical protein [Paludibacteraceae bacterium]